MKLPASPLEITDFKQFMTKLQNSEFWPLNLKVGQAAFHTMRITGILLAVAVFFRIGTFAYANVAGMSTGGLFETMSSPGWIVLDIVMIAVFLIHGLNGVRQTLVEFNIFPQRQKEMFFVVMGIAVAGIAVAVYFLGPLTAPLWEPYVPKFRIPFPIKLPFNIPFLSFTEG